MTAFKHFAPLFGLVPFSRDIVSSAPPVEALVAKDPTRPSNWIEFMPGFKTHFSVGTGTGIAYGALGILGGVPVADGLLAGTMCSIGGILPDLDSASGRPAKEVFGVLGAAVPMLLVNRAGALGLSHDECFMATVAIFMLLRFGVPRILSRITVHRGMWHSIPAMAIAGLVLYLISKCSDPQMRFYRAAGLSAGYLSHLCMDELWSIDLKNGTPRLKKSAGTALKLWSWKYRVATVFTYGLMAACLVFVNQERTQQMVNASGDEGQALSNQFAVDPVTAYPVTREVVEFGSGQSTAVVDWLRSWRGTLSSIIQSDVGSTAGESQSNTERETGTFAQPTVPSSTRPAAPRFEPPNLPQFLRSDPQLTPVEQPAGQQFSATPPELRTSPPFPDSTPESAATGPARVANSQGFDRQMQQPPPVSVPVPGADNQPFGSPYAPYQPPFLAPIPVETGAPPQSESR